MQAGLPDPATLAKLLAYDALTGEIVWLPREPGAFSATSHQTAQSRCAAWNTRCAGKRAFCTPHSEGGLHGKLGPKAVKAHRLAWALHYGEWPVGLIDHINGDRSDNRSSNLRVVTPLENMRNVGVGARNKLGALGVYWVERCQSFTAEIKVNRKKHHLGYFKKLEDAVAARRSAEAEFGFHPNHGMRRTLYSRKEP